MKRIKCYFRQLWFGKYTVRKLLFPYPEGYTAYHKRKDTMEGVYTTKEGAELICKHLNNNI